MTGVAIDVRALMDDVTERLASHFHRSIDCFLILECYLSCLDIFCIFLIQISRLHYLYILGTVSTRVSRVKKGSLDSQPFFLCLLLYPLPPHWNPQQNFLRYYTSAAC